MEFLVDIKKKLYGFQLDVKLQSKEEVIGILGASGSGKSMLLRCIAGLVKPDQGQIIINGKTFFDSEKRINLSMGERKVGFLFQNYALFPNMTIEENIAFGLDKLSKIEIKNRVSALMEKYHLGDIGKRYPSQISGGQQQRVALARAVAVEPDILLLDEPFSALDVHLRNHMMREMAELLKDFQGMTLFVTHNREEAYRLSDYIAVFNTGKVEIYGQKDDIFKWPASLETAKITGCKNIVAATRLSENRLYVPQWDISLATEKKITAASGYLGIRANQVKLVDKQEGQQQNSFLVWIADESDGPFRTSLYLKIGCCPNSRDDFHIQCEISREERNRLDNLCEPFVIYINPEYVFFVVH
ncbi:MAG: molybdate transport system ATP-binding protein [Acetobacterium sp.]|jgi:ABC-type sulfate/molybdate transport systems ATPase subunit|uniref:sulfate/molybdate ABC transporter ATP-binding protein n=1 Tax=Acetobacterium TaxID=33951 RepID=UPI000DBEBB53|nr:sulfate/molybdate ABC transporter ATP-binding protein [Acetobacterium sp. KB-1]AWW26639.1 ABC transporter [Acetobacterium sp. KB-1]MDK2941238.1 molybdate transport system ATP-binding protein [Acetobacterium sp.]